MYSEFSNLFLEIFNNFLSVGNLGNWLLLLLPWLIYLCSIVSHILQIRTMTFPSCGIAQNFLKNLAEACPSMSHKLLVLVHHFRPVNPPVISEHLCHQTGQHPLNSEASSASVVLEKPGLQNCFPVEPYSTSISSSLFDQLLQHWRGENS